LTRHCIQATESLSDIAAAFRLSGWQGLYFAPVNADFRRQYPDPWQIPPGVEIGIPGSPDEQFFALQRRSADLQARENTIKQLAARQQELLLAPFGATNSEPPQTLVARLAEDIVRSTVSAIETLKAPDWVNPHRDLALLEDALQRWRIDGLDAAASLLSLLTRAVQRVPWSVPSPIARAWCDPSSAQFWAKQFIMPAKTSFATDPQVQRQSVRAMIGAQQTVVDQLVRHLRGMRTAAIMESNHLARLADDAD
jgi:hypothetical protein